MAPREPAWWYRDDATTARLLGPVGRLWAGVADRRLKAPGAYRSALPVVCIGNFTAGGTGKTPLARRVAADLARLGRRAVVLSRGHGGRIAGPHWVDARADSAADVGDEPLLHAAAGPVVVARDRAAGARLIEAEGTPGDVIVMDDGLQNPSLAKDLVIAVVDGQRGLGNGRTIPAGPLRASFAAQLDLVDAIVVNTPADGARPVRDIGEMLRRRFEGPVLAATTRPAGPTEWLAELPVVAWAGVANPGRFFAMLASLGAVTAETIVFADHHVPTDREAERLLAMADRLGARLVTTEKDMARLAGASASLAVLATRSRTLAIELGFDGRDAGRLMALLEGLPRRQMLPPPCAPVPGPVPPR